MLNLSTNLGVTSSSGGGGGGSGGLSVPPGAAAGSPPWKEHHVNEICVAPADLGDAVTSLLHTILFTRAPGPVRPSEATCHAFPNITYSLCAVGDVSRKVEHAVKSFEESIVAAAAMGPPMPYGHQGSGYYSQTQQPATNHYGGRRRGSGSDALGIPSGGSASGCLVVTFFERKVKKALFGLMSNEEKVLFEKWVVPVTVVAPASAYDTESLSADAEHALQNALLHILSAVQTIDHIPNAMYDFEITSFGSMEAMHSDGAYALGLQGSGSVRLMA
uniref:Autophagy-related protein 101 n=1 Tax=Globisporangium ultimum (strain ATCC 200006 / CBS 805.95 / DAOM BR144) TaxID=431595 RepID=K3WCJ9_GLOUD